MAALPEIEAVKITEVVDHEPSHRRVVGLLLVAAVAVTLTVAVLRLPREDSPLPAIARFAMVVALPRWHTTEPVSEVVYGTRGFDTFGETFLLLAAVVGTTTVARRRELRRGFIGEELAGEREQSQVSESSPTADHPETASQAQPETASQAEAETASQGEAHGAQPATASRAQSDARRAEAGEQGSGHHIATPDETPLGTPGPETAEAMTVVIRAAVRAVAPILGIAGLYLVAWGYSPGGGFPAGAVLLGLVLFVYVAYGYRRVERVIRPDVIEPLELAGALAIIAIEALGLFLKGSFSANFLPLGPVSTIRSGGILQAFSVSEFVEVATGLTLAIFGLLGMGHDWSRDEAALTQDATGRDATARDATARDATGRDATDE
jgi:multicomponent Na+:H+ antiporter subunit B